MQALIREFQKKIASALLLAFAVALASCASMKEPTALIDDPAEKRDSLLPWNKPEKWEQGGQLAGITDRR